jgi:hypothetical protein
MTHICDLGPADDPSEEHRLALSEALGLGTGAPWDAIRERAAELAAVSAVRPPATDRTALREAIAKALRYWVHPTDRGTAAEAVLAALPAADRAAVERARVIAQRLAAHAAGFQDVLDESDRGPWGRMVGADIAALRTALAEPVAVRVRATDQAALRERIAEALYESCATEADVIRLMADAVLAVLPVPADRAAVLRDAEDAVEGLFIEDENPDERSLGFNAALDEVITELRRLAAEPAAAEPDQTDQTPVVCEGFQWIGQSFATCDRCGQPAWDHAGEDVAAEGAGPFDYRRTVRLWEPGEADAIRAKWGTPDADAPAAGAQQPKAIRCDIAVMHRPHPAHDWTQRPEGPVRRCPGVAQAEEAGA